MERLTKLTCVLSLSLTAIAGSCAAHAATLDEQIAARFNALEKENAALRARVNRLETSKAAIEPRARLQNANDLAASSNGLLRDNFVKAPNIVISKPQPHFEVSGSLLYLQPGAGNLEYGTLVTPLPAATPHWNNQSLKPDFSPAFNFGVRYMVTEGDDIRLNWTHLNTTANASFAGSPTQMVGPPYLIGPEAGLYKVGFGAVQSKYDAVDLDGGHTFCTACPFQMRLFGGVEVAHIGQNLNGLFESPDGTDFNRVHHHLVVYRRRPPFGVQRPVCFRRNPIHRRSGSCGIDRHFAEPHQFLREFSDGRTQQSVSNVARRNAGHSQHRRQIGHRLFLSGQHLRTIQGRAGLSGGGLFQCGQSVFTHPGADKPHAAARRSLPGNGATSAEQLHDPGTVCDGQLGVLMMHGLYRSGIIGNNR